jgi:hypothetical protein
LSRHQRRRRERRLITLSPGGHHFLDDLAQFLEGVLAVAAIPLGEFDEQLIDASSGAAATPGVPGSRVVGESVGSRFGHPDEQRLYGRFKADQLVVNLKETSNLFFLCHRPPGQNKPAFSYLRLVCQRLELLDGTELDQACTFKNIHF